MQGKDLSEAANNREAIAHIKSLYLRQKISREVAEALASPIIARINKRTEEICKKNKKRPYKITFIGLMR